METSDLWLFIHASNLLPSTPHPTPLQLGLIIIVLSHIVITPMPNTSYYTAKHLSLHCQALANDGGIFSIAAFAAAVLFSWLQSACPAVGYRERRN